MQHSEIKSVSTDSFKIRYFTFGHGTRAFIIIPGVSMMSVMLSADAITQGFDIFTERYTVYVFDQEEYLDEHYSVPSAADHIAAAMKQLGIEQADVFGASQGGMIALYLAIHHSDLIHAIYLGGTLARQNPLSLDMLGKWMMLAQGGNVQALNHFCYINLYSPEFYNLFADTFLKMEQAGGAKEMERFYYMVKAAREFDCYQDLDKIKCPVFAIGSKADKVLGGAATQEIADKLGCYCYLYDGYGHAFYDEAPDFRPKMLEQLSALDQ